MIFTSGPLSLPALRNGGGTAPRKRLEAQTECSGSFGHNDASN
jgi:hypothetical protein